MLLLLYILYVIAVIYTVCYCCYIYCMLLLLYILYVIAVIYTVCYCCCRAVNEIGTCIVVVCTVKPYVYKGNNQIYETKFNSFLV